MQKIKCADCGFLGVFDERTDEVKEATARARQSGEQATSAQTTHRAKVFCYRNAREMDWATINPEQVATLVNEPIDCVSYLAWSPGKSPKEHEEMTILEKVKAEFAKNREEDLREADRRHQENVNLTTKSLKIADKGVEVAASSAHRSLILAIFSVLCAVASAVAAWVAIAIME